MEPKSPISSHFLHAGNDLALSPNQRLHPVPLLLTGNSTEVFLEIVGFWTPEYLAHRRDTLRQFRRHRMLIVVPEESIRGTATIPENTLVYRTALKIGPLMKALETLKQPSLCLRLRAPHFYPD